MDSSKLSSSALVVRSALITVIRPRMIDRCRLTTSRIVISSEDKPMTWSMLGSGCAAIT